MANRAAPTPLERALSGVKNMVFTWEDTALLHSMGYIDNICYVKLGIETKSAFRLYNHFYSLLAVADKFINKLLVC